MDNIVTEKRCSKCETVKRISDFRKSGKKSGRRSSCKECDKLSLNKERARNYQRGWRRLHPGYYKKYSGRYDYGEYHKQWVARNPGYFVEANRKRKYGITSADYERMLNEQGGRCAICEEKPDKLFVDHDHETGLVRELLCRSCNTGIGFLKDNLKVLASAEKYLIKHKNPKGQLNNEYREPKCGRTDP